jgi:FMN-dependent NADH-azoreductase
LNPDDDVIELDLYKTSVPMVDGDVLSAWNSLRAGVAWEALSAAQRDKVSAIAAFTDSFVEADKYIFVSPMWNLSVPPMLKAYIDTIVIAGKTFKYTAEGPVGLMQGKKGIHIQARGGSYSGPLSALEFGDSYLKAIMSFVGVEMLDSVIAEGMSYAPEQAEHIRGAAIAFAEQAAKQLASA